MPIRNQMLAILQLQDEGTQIDAFVNDLIHTPKELSVLKVVLNMPDPLFR